MSGGLIPNRMLFDFEFPLRFRDKPPAIDGSLRGWTDAELLPPLSLLDRTEPFAPVWACWNETGLFVACHVSGKRQPLRCDPKVFWKSDNLRLCTDMRDARQNKRATRFCQQFYFLPIGGGKKGDQAVAGSAKIHRAREDAPLFTSQASGHDAKQYHGTRTYGADPTPKRGVSQPVAGAPGSDPCYTFAHPDVASRSDESQGTPSDKTPARIKTASSVSATGYRLEAHIPGGCLSGFDPLQHPRIGFYYMLEDRDHGRQYLTVGDDLNWYTDPSSWATAVLTRS